MIPAFRVFLCSIIMVSFCVLCPAPAQSSQQKMLIGLVPEVNVFKQKKRYELLGEYLSKKTGIKIDFTILSRYGNIIERFTTEKMDGAFFGSFTGALAIKKLNVIPLVRPVGQDGLSTYQGYIFVRSDGGIRTARDMKLKKMAYVDKATTAGYLFPLAYLKDSGITDTEHFFSETFFAGSHDAAIKAVLDRKADIGAAKHSVYEYEKSINPRISKELVVLAKSPAVPSNGFCVRSGLPEPARNKLKSAMMNMHSDPEGKRVLLQFGAVKFVETTVEDYAPVFDMAKKCRIDIMSYDYQNK